MRKSKRGFTLIEVLVVIAIVAVLAAILFPIFVGARERARQATCLTHLSQLGRAMRAYCDDWHGQFPTARVADGETPAGTCLNWCGSYAVGGTVQFERGQLYPYVRNTRIILCPSDRGRRAPQCSMNPYPLSYSMNFMLSWRNCETMAKPGLPGSGRNTRLGKILLLVHEKRETINDGDFNWASYFDIPDDVHYDGTTILFCDLHAKWQNAKTIRAAIVKGEYNPDIPQP